MRLLLDACTFLWLASDDPQLSRTARERCRLPLPEPAGQYVVSRREWLQVAHLAFDEDAAAHDAVLPPIHRDPFDRGLVSQAILHGLTIVTPDHHIARYPAPVLW